MYELTIESDFAAAHRLVGYQGMCENLHGHNWKVEVTIKSPVLNNLGMVMDFTDLKGLLGDILDRLDHKYLNDIGPFATINPTTENLARYVCEELGKTLPKGVSVAVVRIWESACSSAAYHPGGPKALA